MLLACWKVLDEPLPTRPPVGAPDAWLASSGGQPRPALPCHRRTGRPGAGARRLPGTSCPSTAVLEGHLHFAPAAPQPPPRPWC
ncbi:hypothetical protein DSL92_04135 [Billgrantia gudaonensis]|uniref:Uncharacterized protein n=1 Tax=Billgrantia gudaonensis TaxID=376427 RepID=A0A432JJM0_9GAMM|nr:hypothetical protein DSL92_04135 [Halomonas gudaonensis]